MSIMMSHLRGAVWRGPVAGIAAVMGPVRLTALVASAGLLVGGVGVGVGAQSVVAPTPEAILADATKGLAQATSYHLRITDGQGGVGTADIFAAAPGRATLTDGRARVSVVVTTTMAYIKGNRAFWAQGDEGFTPKVARRLAGRWLREPVKEGGAEGEYRLEIQTLLDDLRPAVLSKCLIGTTGTLTLEPAATVNGQAATVLRDAGDKPGSAPRRITVTATPPILPLRVVQTGRRRAGVPRDANCASSVKNTTKRSEIRLSRFGKVGAVTAPRGAVTVRQVLGR